MNLNKLIENTLTEKVVLSSPQMDLREYCFEVFELTKKIPFTGLKFDTSLIDLEYNMSKYALNLEINLFEKRLLILKSKENRNDSLIESFEGTIGSLRYVLNVLVKIEEMMLEYRISRQRNADLELINLKLLDENNKLKELNKKILNQI